MIRRVILSSTLLLVTSLIGVNSLFWISSGVDINIPNAISTYLPFPEEEIIKSFTRSNSYLLNGKFSQALVEINRAIKFQPTNPDFYVTRGIVNEKLLRWDEAISDYTRANHMKKSKLFGRDDATIFSNLANAEAGANRFPDALRDFNYAVKLDSHFLAPQIGRALVQFQLGDFDEAFSFFQELVVDYPSFADGQACYAISLYQQGNQEEAVEAWSTALELDRRYADTEWLQTIRRLPPRLISYANELQRLGYLQGHDREL